MAGMDHDPRALGRNRKPVGAQAMAGHGAEAGQLRQTERHRNAALAGLASAPPPPEPKVEGAVQTFTTVSWTTPFRSERRYVVHWRRTDENQWTHSTTHSPTCDEGGNLDRHCELVLPHIRVDDWVFGVSSVSKDGFESPVASAVPGGAFRPYVAPEKS